MNAGVPEALDAKFQVSLCQPEVVVTASVSTARFMSLWFSTFRRMFLPAADDQTFAEIVLYVEVISAVEFCAKKVTPDQLTLPLVVLSAV